MSKFSPVMYEQPLNSKRAKHNKLRRAAPDKQGDGKEAGIQGDPEISFYGRKMVVGSQAVNHRDWKSLVQLRHSLDNTVLFLWGSVQIGRELRATVEPLAYGVGKQTLRDAVQRGSQNSQNHCEF